MSKKKHYHQTNTVGSDGKIVTTIVEEEVDEEEAVVEETVEDSATDIAEPEETVEEDSAIAEEDREEYKEAFKKASEDTGIDAGDFYTEKPAELPHMEKATPPTYKHIYRVRLSWDRRDTQIFSSPDAETAVAEACKHEGYKVFVDDDGELFKDPWEAIPVAKEPSEFVPVRHPIPDSSIELVDEPIYATAIDKTSFMKITGTMYFYDNVVSNGKAKIMNRVPDYSKERKNPSMIIGYINV